MAAGRDALRPAILFALLTAVTVATASAAPAQFDIRRQGAAGALTQFARQAGIPVLFPFDLVSGRTANAVQGRFEPQEALQRLLEGTGLEAKSDAQGQISVRERPRQRPTTGGLIATLEAAKLDPVAMGMVIAPEPVVEVTVSGSRIERDGMVTPTPVTAIHTAELQSMGPGGLVDALVQLPQFLNNDTPQTQAFASGGAAGASYLNLRGLGSSRTLLLVDGRRIVPTTRGGAVDVALLPKSLLRRIEVVTGGASAAHGSDAVSGVVNLLLDTEADGLKVRLQGGLSDLGDAAHQESAVTWGTALGEHSHLVMSGEWNRTEGVRGYGDRDWFGSWAVIPNPDPSGPATLVARDVHATEYTTGGLIPRGPLAGTQFLSGGLPAPFARGTLAGAQAQVGGSGADPGRDLVWIQPDQRHGSGFAKLSTTWDDGTTSFVQVLAGFSDNHYEKDPSNQWGPWEATIYADNAFLPATTRAAMQTAGIDSVPLARLSPDIGAVQVNNRSRMLSTTAGFESLIGSGWELGGYYQYGRNHAELAYDGTARVDRIYRAFDSVVDSRTGATVCRSSLTFPDDGCVPANPFGPGSISVAARDYITEGGTEQDQVITQHVGEIKAQGPAMTLPAGPASLAFGTGFRREAVANEPQRWPDSIVGRTVPAAETEGYRGLPPSYVGSPFLFERTASSVVNGSYSVWELFAESDLPVASDVRGFQRVDLNFAARYAHYTGSGGSMAYKGGVDWRIGSQLRLRASRSRDIRAGTLSERFDFSGVGTGIIDRARPGSPNYAITVIRGGNPNIDPERADTLTFGAVLQPALVPGLSLSIDYFDIRVRDAIASLGAQSILDRCLAGQSSYCDFVLRSPVTGLVTQINNSFLNIAEARARGVDLELSMRRRIALFGGEEAMALRLFANRAIEASTTPFEAPKIDRVGQTGLPGGAPRWQANASLVYERGSVQLTLQQRLISSGSYNATFGPMDIDDNHVGSAAYTNLRASWRFGHDPESMLLFLNVINAFDRDPPLAPSWGFVGSSHTNEALFDAIGRRYVLGLRLRL
ncbi:MAG: TonB-dependent receptor [Steroidobacteraceae bacterium]